MHQVIHSDTICQLGEGVLWHPRRAALFWCDILGGRLYERGASGQRHWDFGRMISALGWIDDSRLLVATERDIVCFDLTTGQEEALAPLEADRPETRSNDGRADPYGGFWIGTMGKMAEPSAGAIYRFYKGTVHRLFDGITISNAICFTPDGRFACFADTATQQVRRVSLDADGWPAGVATVWLDLRDAGLNPDGAVFARDGTFWNAQWGAGRVACYDPQGRFLSAVPLPAQQVTCPAFGGRDGTTLYVTSAAQGASPDDAQAGMTFAVETPVRGQDEHRVLLP